jgi:ankyrin repeat protein
MQSQLLRKVSSGNAADLQKHLDKLNTPTEKLNSITSSKKNPLHRAILLGQYECTALLIRAKANLNLRSTEGLTPLHIAITSGNQPLVDLLLTYNADITLPTSNEGHLPLSQALIHSKYEIFSKYDRIGVKMITNV